MRFEREDRGDVAVSEEADRRAKTVKVHESVAVGEDVGVLVARGAVADLENAVHRDWPERERREKFPVAAGQRRFRPPGRFQRHGIAGVSVVEAAHYLVAVA